MEKRMPYVIGKSEKAPKKHFKVTLLVGTRPEAIKMAPIISLLKGTPAYETEILLSGQHTAMCTDALKSFDIRPDHLLTQTISDFSLTGQLTQYMRLLTSHLSQHPTDLLLVHGDTTTGLSGALAAYYSKIPVGHVEAGLRSHDMMNPFPEEANRRLIDPLCSLLFAPTQGAKDNLYQENISLDKITVTGNTVVDAVHHLANRLAPLESMSRFQSICSKGHRILLVTAHRRENWGKPMTNICNALLALVRKFSDIAVIFPVHPNPNVQEVVKPILSGHPRILLTSPLDYETLITVLRDAYIVLTDSGGIQEEAPSVSTPVLVLRSVTERPEAIAAGTAQLIGTEKEHILTETSKLLNDSCLCHQMISSGNPFGDGKAAARIRRSIDHWRHGRPRPRDEGSWTLAPPKGATSVVQNA